MPIIDGTRLVRLSTGVLEEYTIASMPPYIAVSHTWADNLFNPKCRFCETAGGQALVSMVATRKQFFGDLDHCWVDTFCIDQTVEEDKHRQIPLMGSIYAGAVSVAITLPIELKANQNDVDKLAQALEPAIKMFEEDDWSVAKTRWCREEPGRSLITTALNGISRLIEGSWSTRVWTAQEFLLAKTVIWVGVDQHSFFIQDSHFLAMIFILSELIGVSFSIEQYERLQRLNQAIRPLLIYRLQNVDRTRFITQMSQRHCSLPQDMIYGAMAASGVQINVGKTQDLEDIWRRWWEQAIKQQHVRWACCAVMWKTPGIPPTPRYPNCAMPAFEVRQIASDVLNLDGVEPLGPVELNRGTVSLYGYDVGVCKIVTHLGHYANGIRDEARVVYPNLTFMLWCRGNFNLAFRIATAFSRGHFSVRNLLLIAQVLKFNFSKAVWAVKNHRQYYFNPVFRSYEQHRIYAHFTRIQGHQLDSVAGTGLEVYLATVSNSITSTDVAVLMPGNAPGGNLRALDFNAIHAKDEYAGRFLTIVQTPKLSTPSSPTYPPDNETLHKVGVTLPVKFFFLEMYGQHDFEGGEPTLFHIGGAGCTICTAEKPEPAPDTITSDIGLHTGPDPPRMPNIQIKPRVRASPFDPRKTRRPIAVVSVRYLFRYSHQIRWYEHGHTALPQYPKPLRRRPKIEINTEDSCNDYLRAKLRPTEGNKKFPSGMTATDLRAKQKEIRKKREGSV